MRTTNPRAVIPAALLGLLLIFAFAKFAFSRCRFYCRFSFPFHVAALRV
jgi:hypothetical protein